VHVLEQLDRAHPAVAHRRVGGRAGHLEPERQGARGGGDHRTVRRLRDDAGVAAVAAGQRRPGAQAAVLLAHDAVHGERTDERDPGVAQRPDGRDRGDQAGLHVAGPAAVDGAAVQPGREGIAGPEGTIAGGDHVGVATEDQSGVTGLGCGHSADDAPGLGALDLLSGGVRRGGRRGQVDLPAVDVAAERGELVGDQVLHVDLGVRAADRRDGEGSAQQVDGPRLVDGGEDAGLGVGQGDGHGPESGTGTCRTPARAGGLSRSRRWWCAGALPVGRRRRRSW
jgi:hypothetical protein